MSLKDIILASTLSAVMLGCYQAKDLQTQAHTPKSYISQAQISPRKNLFYTLSEASKQGLKSPLCHHGMQGKYGYTDLKLKVKHIDYARKYNLNLSRHSYKYYDSETGQEIIDKIFRDLIENRCKHSPLHSANTHIHYRILPLSILAKTQNFTASQSGKTEISADSKDIYYNIFIRRDSLVPVIATLAHEHGHIMSSNPYPVYDEVSAMLAEDIFVHDLAGTNPILREKDK